MQSECAGVQCECVDGCTTVGAEGSNTNTGVADKGVGEGVCGCEVRAAWREVRAMDRCRLAVGSRRAVLSWLILSRRHLRGPFFKEPVPQDR